MLEESCIKFINGLASAAPVPGGGSASALTAALGMALGSMVGELTIGKKNYEQYETEISDLLFRSTELIHEFTELVQKDIDAFSRLSRAYKLPKNTDEEKTRRTAEIQESVKGAAEAPLAIAEACVKALKLLDSYSIIGNKNVISDAGTGTALCEAALKGSRLNVLVNLKSMKDETLRDELYQRLNAVIDMGIHLADITYSRVEKACEI